MFLNIYLATTISSIIITKLFYSIFIKKAKSKGIKFKNTSFNDHSALEIVGIVFGLALELVPVLTEIIAYKAIKSAVTEKGYHDAIAALLKKNLICTEEDIELTSDTTDPKIDIEFSKTETSVPVLTKEERIKLGQALIEKQKLARQELERRKAESKDTALTYLDLVGDKIHMPDIDGQDLSDEQHFGR